MTEMDDPLAPSLSPEYAAGTKNVSRCQTDIGFPTSRNAVFVSVNCRFCITDTRISDIFSPLRSAHELPHPLSRVVCTDTPDWSDMRIALNFLGALLVLAGGVFFFQGINVIPGSFMTGQTRWALYGALFVIAGVGLLILANRRRA